MPVLKFTNFLAASRKRNMIGFGLFRSNANADLSVIDDLASGAVTISGAQNGTNSVFTISALTSADNLILARNGLIQAPTIDFTVSGHILTLVVPPAADDILMAFVTGGE